MTCPFQAGDRFRVRRDYSCFNHTFHAGEAVVFCSYSYSPKEGITRYWFQSLESGEQNIWHAFDDESTEADLHEMFEPIKGI